MKKYSYNIVISIATSLFFSLSLNTQGQWWKDWEKDTINNPMIHGSSAYWFDHAFYQDIIYEDSLFKMWFTGWADGEDIRHIGYAESFDGKNWYVDPDPVITRPPGNWDESMHVGTILRIKDTLRMWYAGSINPCATHNNSIGYAWSIDGNSWNVRPTPLINPGNWQEPWMHQPRVYYDGTMYHMYYSNLVETSYATSTNGIDWTKDVLNSPVLQPGPPGSYYDEGICPGGILVKEDTLNMWFWATGEHYSIGYAWSTDYINWTISDEPVIDKGTTGSWDADGVTYTTIMINNGKYRMWYSAGDEDLNLSIGYVEGDTVFSCLSSNKIFNSQNEIDDFRSTFFYCYEISGNVTISGNDISNLSGLSQITDIWGDLIIIDNENLGSLMEFNDSLTVWGDLTITNNTLLSSCHTHAVCDYISVPLGTVTIVNNATGCNSVQEVQDQCLTVGIQDYDTEDAISVYPNPFADATHLRYQIKGKRLTILDLYQISGTRIHRLMNEVKLPGEYQMEVDVSDLPAGVYFLRFQSGNDVVVKKLVNTASH
jgi:predicted GH43/DUF377 family glycosyl hydrolase